MIPQFNRAGANPAIDLCRSEVVVKNFSAVVLDDGVNKRTVLLNRPFYGLHVPPGIWAAEQGFSSGSICLVLASEGYLEDDYIRGYEDFIKYRKGL